jgi:hypothetical protein
VRDSKGVAIPHIFGRRRCAPSHTMSTVIWSRTTVLGSNRVAGTCIRTPC